MAIELVPYQADWPEKFLAKKRQLIGLPHVLEVEHVGSTAVPGLSAKPVIDIMIGADDLALDLVEGVKALGYDYKPEFEIEVPDRRFFMKKGRVHIHAVLMGSSWWKRHLFFRDYLRKHKDICKEYEALKQRLATIHTDTLAYARAKTPFIREIEKEMMGDGKSG
ncbi:MAG: hypothetical protein SP1CHLAM54_04270 [Chlamydiia bacterium]|nr:hypothetical protein [Chlamydiia bacterium]MCH9615341.1 hypothetical protein [Chlamydiia bacterium]MCH9628337.1 hypothetical protein [Chlamydiia bacterium]